MRASNVSQVCLTAWRCFNPTTGEEICNPVTGRQIIDTFNKFTNLTSGPFKRFAVEWIPFHVERKLRERARIITMDGTYGYLLADKIDPCRPLLIDREANYRSLILAVDSWGVNFMNSANKRPFVNRVAKEAEDMADVINTELNKIAA
ncbi:MAG TPA: hypothetical protein VFO38_04570 [Candidatus Saccharimonadales bacterium]|nr:hypothetical protein [Candidatus Saccharimonadales bacterium]